MKFRKLTDDLVTSNEFDMYANVESERSMFVDMLNKSIVSRNALTAGYTQNGDNETSLKLFLQTKTRQRLSYTLHFWKSYWCTFQPR